MSAVNNNVSMPSLPSRSVFVQKEEKSDRMLRIDSIVAQSWYVLGVALTGATLFAGFVTTIFPTSLSFTILTVSIVALSLLATKVAVSALEPHLSPRMKEVADYVQATLGDILLAMSDLFVKPLYIYKKFFHKTEMKEGRPIVWIHGYGGEAAANWYKEYRLEHACMGPLFTINLGSAMLFDINDHAAKLKAFLEKVRKKTGRDDVTIICHSMGGVVATHFLNEHCDEKTQVKEIVTLGSPLQGTPIASVASLNPLDKCAKDMRQDSELIKNLATKVKTKSKTRFLHVASKNDLIIPVESALFKNHEGENVERVLVSGVGHCGLPFSDAAIDSVIDFLKRDTEYQSAHVKHTTSAAIAAAA